MNLKIVLIVVLILCLTSCSFEEIKTSFLSNNDIANNMFEDIISAVETKDKEKLKNLFSMQIQNDISYLEEDADDFIEFIEGDILSYSDASENGVPAKTELDDEKTRKEIGPAFELKTSEGTYYISFIQCIQDEFNDGGEGLICLYIINAESWNHDYVYRVGVGSGIPGIHIEN